ALIGRGDVAQLTEAGGRECGNMKAFVVETRYVLPDGSRRWMRNNVSAISDHGAAVRHLMLVAEDVTDRRRADDDLKRAHDDLQQELEERSASLAQTSELLHSEAEQ